MIPSLRNMSQNESPLNSIGQRLPYTVPEGFFEHLEERTIATIQSAPTAAKASPKRQKKGLHRTVAFISSIAAVVALVVCWSVWHKPSIQADAPTVDDVAQAFASLTTADQAYLLELYQEDTFINDNIYDYDTQQTNSQD